MSNEGEVDRVDAKQKPEKRSLLRKYEIPIEHLSYEFISRCTDAKTLERIVLILRSGEEGTYPDLTKHAETHLAEIKPTSAVLRKAEPVLRRNMLNTEERREIDDDISSWTREMQSREKDLNEGKATLIDDPCSQPEVRKIKSDVTQDKKMRRVNERKRDKPKRIDSCDYAAWDKYDADTEINRIDLQDEQRQAEMKRIQERRKELDKTNKTARKTALDKFSLTGTEIDVLAAQEREKGNEAFRAADYEEALRHYSASVDIDANLNAYNNRAMTFIKLQRYEDALNDCNVVLSMDYKNIKGLLRRALTLEHLEKVQEALADYEAVLKLEPTNKIAISGVNKLRKPCESRKIRMKIEQESVDDNEDKVKQIKSGRIAKTNYIECPKQHINNDICYCDRAPGSSRNVATKPHVKTGYCVQTESSKATATDVVANKSNRKITRDSSSGNKLSPAAKDFGSRDKMATLQNFKNEDISMIIPESFNRSRDAEGSLKKSIFSCISVPRKANPSTVIIEELPNDEICGKQKVVNSEKTQVERKEDTDSKKEKNMSIRESCVNKNNKPFSPGKKDATKINSISNNIETFDRCGKSNEINDSRETKMEVKKEMSEKGKEKHALTEKSDTDENKNAFSLGRESKTKTSSSASNKIHMENGFYQEAYGRKLEMSLEKLEHIESPYEFLRLWQSLKDDANLTSHARLLRIISHQDINKIIGNKLDATMFSLILRCLEQQFCTPKDIDILANLLDSLSQLNRFSIIRMFMDSNDKKALGNILHFLEKENSLKASQLRQIYVT